MKKTNLTILLSLIACILVIMQCKKRELGKVLKDSQNQSILNTPPPIPVSKYEIENQLRWIARGYPEVNANHSPALFNFLNGFLIPKEYYTETHSVMEPFCNASVGILLENEVFQAINRLPNSSGYDRGYFYGFNFENCNYSTVIRIVDTPNLSNPVVFTYESSTGSDSSWGYFWNSGLDSVLLTSNNYDLYYVFQISAESNCSNGLVSELTGCNGNGVCEELQGETAANCVDCRTPNAPNEKVLKLVWVRINEDKKMFDEAWGQNKYELGWDFAVANGTQGLIHHYRDGQDFDIYNKWKVKQIPIKRNNRRGLKGTVTSKQYKPSPASTSKMAVLFRKYDFTNHQIYLSFWEDDKNGKKSNTHIKNQIGALINYLPLVIGFNEEWAKRTNGGTFDNGGFDPGGILYVPNNSVWTPEIIDGIPCMVIDVTSPGLNEICAKLAYEL